MLPQHGLDAATWVPLADPPPLAFDHDAILATTRPLLASLLWRDLAFTRALIRIRRTRPIFRQTRFLHGSHIAQDLPDIAWLTPAGTATPPRLPRVRHDWRLPSRRVRRPSSP